MNRICEQLGCKLPVIEGGLAYVGNGLLAAAVSNGGGFGQIGSGGRSPENLRQEIQIAQSLTNQPFGVNLPISEHRDVSDYIDVLMAFRGVLRAVSLSAGNPRPWIKPLQQAGFTVMTLVSTPEQAKKVEAAGTDIVICEGMEAGGHNGTSELPSMVLIPLVRAAVSIPVVAAGGIANSSTAKAAMLLGADGVQLGTRFVATKECAAHPLYKEALLKAKATDTRIIERSFGRVTRVLNSPYVQKVLEQEITTPGDIEILLPMVSGGKNRAAALEGRLDEGWLNCGMSVGFIESIPSAAEIVRDVMSV